MRIVVHDYAGHAFPTSLSRALAARGHEVVHTFAESVRIEMDLRFEAAAAQEMAEDFAGDSTFRVPGVDWQRTAERVLTLERVSGARVDDHAAVTSMGLDSVGIVKTATPSSYRAAAARSPASRRTA